MSIHVSPYDVTVVDKVLNEETNEEIDPFDVLNKYCFVRGAIKIESLFIGKTISLQIKLYEVVVRMIDSERKTLLTTNVIRKIDMDSSDIFDVLNKKEDGQENSKMSDTNSLSGNHDDSDESEQEDSDDEEESHSETMTTPPPTPVKAPPAAPVKPTRGRQKAK